jgi:hypothetical protein
MDYPIYFTMFKEWLIVTASGSLDEWLKRLVSQAPGVPVLAPPEPSDRSVR